MGEPLNLEIGIAPDGPMKRYLSPTVRPLKSDICTSKMC